MGVACIYIFFFPTCVFSFPSEYFMLTRSLSFLKSNTIKNMGYFSLGFEVNARTRSALQLGPCKIMTIDAHAQHKGCIFECIIEHILLHFFSSSQIDAYLVLILLTFSC